MKALKYLGLAGAAALLMVLGSASQSQAGFGRQYYGGWNHSPRGFYYNTYYYKPYVSYPSYYYNYCIYYPSQPSYVYYFNPYRSAYWGRFDLKTKGYSLLAVADRKELLNDIPESKFPPEGALPAIPDAKDKVQINEPPDLPAAEKVAQGNGKATADEKPVTPKAAFDEDPDKVTANPPATPPANAPVTPPVGDVNPDKGGVAPVAPPVTPDAAKPIQTGAVPQADPIAAAPNGGVAPVTPAPIGGVPPTSGVPPPVTPVDLPKTDQGFVLPYGYGYGNCHHRCH